MNDRIPGGEAAWLARFFAGRNALHWDAITGNTAPMAWSEQVIPWIDYFLATEGRAPLILPIFSAQGPIAWYAVAHDSNSAAALADELASVVGASYSDFRGHPITHNADDPIEAALHERFGRHLFRFTAVSDRARVGIVSALSLYLTVLRRRPVTPDRTQQPFGKLRGDFDRALLAGNEKAARNLLEALCATGRVNVEQRQFLDIRLQAGLGWQDDIAHNYTLIKAVMDLALPPQTIIDIVDSLYQAHIARMEHDPDSRIIIAEFKQAIARPFSALFKERKGIRHPNVLKAFLLFELTQDEPNPIRCEAILSAYPFGAAGKELLQRWWEHAKKRTPGKTSPEKTLDLVKQALADEDYEAAVDLCQSALPHSWAYSGLLRCAAELHDSALTAKVLALVDDADDSARVIWTERDQTRIDKLRGAQPVAMPSDVRASWLSWSRTVVDCAYQTSPIALLDQCVTQWSVEDYIVDVKSCETLVQLIGNAKGKAEQIFRDAYPYLVEFFVARPAQPVRGFIPLYEMLIKMIAWNDGASPDELALTSELLQALVGLGLSRAHYVEALDDLSEILTANRAFTHLDWALNTTEILGLQSAPDPEARLRYFMQVLDLVRAYAHRVTESQRMILRILAKDYDCLDLLDTLPALDQTDASRDHFGDFAGLIGIYTLTESAGQRAKQVLLKLLPQVRVEINADHAATDRLRHLSTNADIFVFAWRSSKHQAYYCAKEARGDRGLQLPVGKGSASILDSVFKELARQA